MAREAAVGVANHNGWAHLVTVGWDGETAAIVDRRRVVLVADDLPRQPYEHHLAKLPGPQAQALVARIRASAEAHAHTALATLQAELDPAHALTSVAMRSYRFGRLPEDLGEVLDNLPFVYSADAMLFLEALEAAAGALGLAVERHVKGAEFERAASRLGRGAAEVEAWLKGLGLQLGPPWTQEHQRAAAAAIGLLPAA